MRRTPQVGPAQEGAAGVDDVLLPAKKRAAFYALFLATGVDLLALASGTLDPTLRQSYWVTIGMYALLAVMAPVLRYGPKFEVLTIATISGGLLGRYAVVLFAAPEISGIGSALFANHAALIIMYLLAFVSLDKKRAGALSTVLLATNAAILIARLRAEVGLDLQIEGQPHVRTLAVHIICIALLYVLSDSKEHMQQSRATASALTIVAGTDELTGLANRRALSRQLETQLTDDEAGRSPWIVLVDLDHFKAVNDTFGHALGDAVLVRAACALRDAVGGAGTTARWGGEEFLILLPDAMLADAVDLAERCRRALHDLDLHDVGRVTASFGVAGHDGCEALHELIARADDALYSAKANGRDRVEVAPDPWGTGTAAVTVEARS